LKKIASLATNTNGSTEEIMDIINLIKKTPTVKERCGSPNKDRLEYFKLSLLNTLTLDEKLLILKPSLANVTLAEIINHPAYIGVYLFCFHLPKFSKCYYLASALWSTGLFAHLFFIVNNKEYRFRIEKTSTYWCVTEYVCSDRWSPSKNVMITPNLPTYSSLNEAVEAIKLLYKFSDAKRLNIKRYNVTSDCKYSPKSLQHICCFFVGHLLYSHKLLLESLLPKELFDLIESNSFNDYGHQWRY
jgi:hypothetical protein